MRAYDLGKDVWFEGSVNIREEFFGKHEYLSYGKLDRVPFLHLYDQKFCLLGGSDISKRNWKWKLLEQEIHYLSCFIFEVTPIFKKQDEAGFFELSISVVSVQKSPMNNNFQILEGMLMLVSYFHSISLFMPCQIFFVLFIYYFLVMKLIVVKDIFGL